MPETMAEGIRERENSDALASRIWGRRVLIVDDDHAQVLTVERGLAHHGYEFAEAGDGHAALVAVHEAGPGLILMDVEMPGLSGVEVCRIIKANQAQGFGFIPVILMTARQQTAKIKGLELGADDFLVKPFDMLELSARVKSMLRLKLLQDALLEKNRELDRANKELDKKRQELLALSRTDALTAEQWMANGASALVSCTVSVGVATYPDARLDSAEALLRAADQCLYAAKAAGKNAVRQHHG